MCNMSFDFSVFIVIIIFVLQGSIFLQKRYDCRIGCIINIQFVVRRAGFTPPNIKETYLLIHPFFY